MNQSNAYMGLSACACIGPAGDCPCIRRAKGLPVPITETQISPELFALLPDGDKETINRLKVKALGLFMNKKMGGKADEAGCEIDGGSPAECGRSPMCGCPAALDAIGGEPPQASQQQPDVGAASAAIDRACEAWRTVDGMLAGFMPALGRERRELSEGLKHLSDASAALGPVAHAAAKELASSAQVVSELVSAIQEFGDAKYAHASKVFSEAAESDREEARIRVSAAYRRINAAIEGIFAGSIADDGSVVLSASDRERMEWLEEAYSAGTREGWREFMTLVAEFGFRKAIDRTRSAQG